MNDTDVKLDMAVAVIKQVAACPHCPGCKDMAKDYLTNIESFDKTTMDDMSKI